MNMPCRIFLCASVVSCLTAFPQDIVANLSGVWLRTQPVKPESEMHVKIEHNGADIIITMRVKNKGVEETNVARLHIGADQNKNLMHGAPMTSKAGWDGNTLVVDSVARFGTSDLRMTDRWALAPDRKTLEFSERHQFAAEPEGTDVSTFVRQADESWLAQEPPKAAEEVYPNIKVFKGVPADRLPTIMGGFTHSLGVQCTHCHVEGAFEKDDKPTFAKARRMVDMRNWIAKNQKLEVTCWTCHRGHSVPEAGPQINASLWPSELELTAEQGKEPASKVYKNLKFFTSPASGVKSSMLFISASLGVRCPHCHVIGAWEKDDKPAKDAARGMLAMVRDTRAAITDIRVGCATCHHGSPKPEMEPRAGR